MEYKYNSVARERGREREIYIKGQASLFHLGFVSKSSHSNKGDSERQSLDAPALLEEAEVNEEDFAEIEEKKQ